MNNIYIKLFITCITSTHIKIQGTVNWSKRPLQRPQNPRNGPCAGFVTSSSSGHYSLPTLAVHDRKAAFMLQLHTGRFLPKGFNWIERSKALTMYCGQLWV